MEVRTHVARDLLQSADLFKTDKTVIWEYVSNGLQYVDPGTKPEVYVEIEGKRRITIQDNGRGMLWADLDNFFLMHGENLDRRQGKPGRGNFGTGKCAAFGIAEGLRITTIRNGKRSRVELHRSDIESMSSKDPIPVRSLEMEIPTTERNGTLIEISDVHLRSIDQAGVIRFIERHLVHWPKDVTVFVNNHQCEFNEPPTEREETLYPDEDTARTLGNVKLLIKVAKSPLDEDLRGVSVFTKGVWCETTLAGSEGREMSHYLFGEIDIPALDDYRGPNRPIDMSRSMKLNPNNAVVQHAYAFIGAHLERVRRELVKRDRERRSTEELRRLESQAETIAKVINEDFEEYRKRLARVKARRTGGTDRGSGSGGLDLRDVLAADGIGTVPGDFTQEILNPPPPPGPFPQPRDRERNEVETSGQPEVLVASTNGPALGSSTERKQSQSRRPVGGFQVRFDRLGDEEYRAKYVRDERTIYINLDHPQVKTAKGLGDNEDASFRRLAYEVAFAEYAVALASEKVGQDEYLDFTDPIVDIRDTLNRLARKGANLYAIVPV